MPQLRDVAQFVTEKKVGPMWPHSLVHLSVEMRCLLHRALIDQEINMRLQ